MSELKDTQITTFEVETVCQACMQFAANSGIDDLLADLFCINYGQSIPKHECESSSNNVQCDCGCH